MNDKIIIHKLNEVFIKLDCTCDQANEISEHFSCYVPNWRFMPLVKAGVWNGKTSFFDYNNSTLPIGFLKNLLSFCKSFSYECEFTFDPNSLINEITDEEITFFLTKLFPPESKFKLRDYQETAVREMLKNKRSLIELATGAGKSLVIYCVVKYLQQCLKGRFVVIVPSISLVTQLRSDFIDYGFENFDDVFGSIYHDSEKKDFTKQFLVSTWQTLHTLPQLYLDTIHGFLVDEVHTSSFKSKLLLKVLAKLDNAPWRLGCTGSLPREEAINIQTLIGYIGKIVSTVKSSELIEKKILANIQIVNILLKYPETFIEKSGVYNDEIMKINSYFDRNKIFKYIIDKVGDKKNILILVQRIEHLRTVKAYLQSLYPTKKIYDVFGKTDVDEREYVRKIVNVNQGSIIVATFKTFGQGINIPNINIVVFGSSYKKTNVIIQAIGRGLRRTEIKSNMVLFDIVDDLTWQKRTGALGINYLYGHFLERLKIYRSENFPYKNISLRISDI